MGRIVALIAVAAAAAVAAQGKFPTIHIAHMINRRKGARFWPFFTVCWVLRARETGSVLASVQGSSRVPLLGMSRVVQVHTILCPIQNCGLSLFFKFLKAPTQVVIP